MEDLKEDVHYHFCVTSNCDVVYYNETGETFLKDDVKVRIGLKETVDPVSVCYCFGFTEDMIRDEFHRDGRTTIPDRIREEIQAGNCACETKNPQGTCCLGNVNRSVKKIAAECRVSV